MRKSADIRKTEIVAAVMDMADKIGPDRVTTAAVANVVGVTQAALFRHFSTKSDLWVAVAESISIKLTAAWEEAVAGNQTPSERLRALVLSQLSQIEQAPALPMLLFSRELNVENEELRQAFSSRLAAFHSMLAKEFAAGQSSKVFRQAIKADDAAMLLTSLIQGLAIRWSLGARNFNFQQEGKRLLNINLGLLSNEEG